MTLELFLYCEMPLKTKKPAVRGRFACVSLAKRKNPDYRSGTFFFALLVRATADMVCHLKSTFKIIRGICELVK